ncbi:MAG: nucleoside-diphosphate-sugar epimerase [bacterium]|jgi:nucleoside-diphosphate-sugar epimerase
MKTVIIGGSGFIGSRLISEILDKNLLNIDKRKSLNFNNISVLGDITDMQKFSLPSDTDCVVLLAAEHKDNVSPTSLYYDVNENGTRNVLKHMDLIGCKKIIFTSSVAVYGLNKENPNEEHKIDPFNHYGKSKRKAEKVIEQWFEENSVGKSVTILRPTVIFGEKNRGNVFNLLKSIAKGKFLMIGKGNNMKSMAYVGNITSFIKNQIDNSKEGLIIYNYVDKPDVSMSNLVKIVENNLTIKVPSINIPIFFGYLFGLLVDGFSFITKRKLNISFIRIKKFVSTTQFDASKVHSSGWKAPFSLEEGLGRTLNYEFVEDRSEDDKDVFYTE